MKIGVLAVQGAFAEHIAMLHQLGAEAPPIRLPQELKGLDGLIIPGGESTSISLLMQDYRLNGEITKLARDGLPLFGTCAGMILMASQLLENSVEPLGLIDITVRRNAFGRQRESFETKLTIPVLGKKPFPAIFIRAPIIEQVKGKAEILARLTDGTIVAARQDKLLALAFHPELTIDTRLHRYFLNMVTGDK